MIKVCENESVFLDNEKNIGISFVEIYILRYKHFKIEKVLFFESAISRFTTLVVF